MKIVAGNSNRALAEAIGAYLDLPLARCMVKRFADQEIFVEVMENVRGEDVFVIQSTSYPANDHLMELLIMIDALRRASARRITLISPGRTRPPQAISAKLVANDHAPAPTAS
jgi:ribose-phosphate pyrophosphokinase